MYTSLYIILRIYAYTHTIWVEPASKYDASLHTLENLTCTSAYSTKFIKCGIEWHNEFKIWTTYPFLFLTVQKNKKEYS